MDNKDRQLSCPLHVFCLHFYFGVNFTPSSKNCLELQSSPGTPCTPPLQPNSLFFRPRDSCIGGGLVDENPMGMPFEIHIPATLHPAPLIHLS